MAYIGRDISNLSDRVVLDNITTSATATYNLLLNSVAFVPSSAESLTVSLNGVIQKPQSSYTVSGSTIVFASTLSALDSIDFILAERAITLTTVGSGSVGTSQLVDGSVSNAKLANSSITLNGSAVSLGGSATISGGKIGQVLETRLTDTRTTTSTSYSAISGLEASITPSATSSKILLCVHVVFSSSNHSHIKFSRDNGSSFVGNGVASGNRDGVNFYSYTAVNTARSDSMMFLDTTNTASEVTYKAYWRTSAGQTGCLNRTPNDTDANYGARGVSSITLMEVLAWA